MAARTLKFDPSVWGLELGVNRQELEEPELGAGSKKYDLFDREGEMEVRCRARV
jgi:hypothetical protein